MLHSGFFFLFLATNSSMINVLDFIPSLNANADRSKRMTPQTMIFICNHHFIYELYSFSIEPIVAINESLSQQCFNPLLSLRVHVLSFNSKSSLGLLLAVFNCPFLTCSVPCLFRIFLSNLINVTPLNVSHPSTTEWHATSVYHCRTAGLFVSPMLPITNR